MRGRGGEEGSGNGREGRRGGGEGLSREKVGEAAGKEGQEEKVGGGGVVYNRGEGGRGGSSIQ